MKTTIITSVVFLAAVLLSVQSISGEPAVLVDEALLEIVEASNEPESTVNVIVWTEDKSDYGALDSFGEIRHEFDSAPIVSMEVPVGAIEELASSGVVERISIDREVGAFRAQSIVIIKADSAESSFLVNGTDVNISIIDTGLFNHSEFQSPNRIARQKCFISHGSTRCPPSSSDQSDNATDDDPDRHGTHVTGIAAGKGGGANGRGVARNATIFAVKALNASGSGLDSDIAKAIEWAYLNGSQVISLSLGASSSQCYSSQGGLLSSDFVDSAVGNGTVVVVAAGNSGPSSQTVAAPGCAKGAITVGASDDSDTISSFSSRGPTFDNRTKPDIVAPGINIISTFNSTHDAISNGTSQATPHVAGAAVLIMQRYKQINGGFPKPMLVKAILLSSANNTASERNSTYGAGRLDVNKSLEIVNNTRGGNLTQGTGTRFKINTASQGLKVSLVWAENYTIVSDLDLTLQSPGGINYTQPTHSNDTVEQYTNSSAEVGGWIAYVSAPTVTDTQEFFLAVNHNISSDADAPSASASLSSNFSTINATINVTFGASDSNPLNQVNLTITKPNGFQNITTYSGNSSLNFTNTTEAGVYFVEAKAVDNSSNVGTFNTNFTIYRTIDFNQIFNSSSGVAQNFTLRFRNSVTSDLISTLASSNGIASGTINATGLVNMEISHSDNNITLVNTTIDSNQTLNFALESPTVSVSGVDSVLEAFASNISMNFSKVVVKLNYTGTGFTSEDRITIYKCSDFNFTSSSCNGSYNTSTGATRNETEDMVTMESTSFSAYVIVQESAPVVQSSSSGGGGSRGSSSSGGVSTAVSNKTVVKSPNTTQNKSVPVENNTFEPPTNQSVVPEPNDGFVEFIDDILEAIKRFFLNIFR